MSQITKKILPWLLLSSFYGSSTVLAAQLGKLEVLSGGGEPFVAQVQVEALQPEERASLKARLATPEAFRAARLELNPNLSALKFEVRDGGKPGTAVVRITADKPVPAGFMDALIELTWAGGRVAREYTFNVPPGVAPAKPAALPELAPSKPESAKVETKPELKSEAKPAEVKSSEVKSSGLKSSAGPVERTHQVNKGETLSEIALQSVGQGVGLNQAMAAIFEANKNQFIEGSVHLLREGAVLQIPSRTSIRQRSKNEALLILARQDDRNVYALQARQLGLLEASAAVPDQAALKGKGQTPDAGRTATGSIEKNAKPAATANGDRLKIATGNSANGGEAKADAAAEELLAKNKALKEANERISLLEKNVTDLQRLLEMQKDLAGKPETALASEAIKPSPSSPAAGVEGAQATPPSPLGFEVGSADPDATAEAEPPLGTIDPAAAGLDAQAGALPAEAQSGALKPWMLAGGGALALLLGVGLWFGLAKRRKKTLVLAQAAASGAVASAAVASTAASTHTVVADTPVPTEPRGFVEVPNDSGPAYEPEQELLRAEVPSKSVAQVDHEPSLEELMVDHALKDLERGSMAVSSKPANDVPVDEEPNVDDGQALDGQENSILDQEIIPDLQEESEQAATQAETLTAPVDLNFPEDTIENSGAGAERSILDDLGDLERSAAAAQAELEALRKAAAPVGTAAASPAQDPAVEAELVAKAVAPSPTDDDFEKAMAELNLDIPAEPLDEASWQEVATKLDLAGAYVEIGDNDGARELLDEIVKKGDADQIRKAKALLGALA